MLRSLDNDDHVLTRVAQYKALEDEIGLGIARIIVEKKIEGQNRVLAKYGLKPFIEKTPINRCSNETLTNLRYRLSNYEAHCSEFYFKQVFGLIPDRIRPLNRKTFKAYDGINNLFNLGYEVLSWKVHKALVNAKLEPFLGYLHTIQFGKPSLVCDFMEIYRYLVDNFVIGFCKDLSKKDFVTKNEVMSRGKIGKREYLNDVETKDFMVGLDRLFSSFVEIPRIRHGKRQEFETLISEEALLFAKYLRQEREEWIPRLPTI